MNDVMKRHSLVVGVLIAIAIAANFAASSVYADRVRTIGESIEGKIVSSSHNSISLETDDGIQEIEVIDVVGLLFEEEPSGLGQARINLANGGYGTVLERINEIELPQTANQFLKDDFAFIKAEATARLAINKQADPREAGRLVVAHQKKYPLSFHYYQSVETLGDLLRSMGRYDRAVKQYELLAKAPWPSYQSRAALLSGLARQEQGDHTVAIALFDEVIAAGGNSKAIKLQQLDAQLAKAMSLAQTKRQADALEQIQKVILSADNDDADADNEVGQYALAAGYNALGNYYLEQGETTDALLAFLRVDYLHEQSKKIHAESLYHLISLWNRYGEPESAKLARVKLRRLYSETVWATMID